MVRSLKKRFPKRLIHVLPLADGGDGTLDVLVAALKGRLRTTVVEGPLGKRAQATWAIVREGNKRVAVIEMARASGLALVRGKNRIMDATSKGTGELIRAAMDAGCKKIYLGVGGTACGEGGAGALQALGLRYQDREGRSLSARPSELCRLSQIDWTCFDRRIKKTEIVVLCDVKNHLLGPNGSARTFGPQKGATPSQVEALEKTLRLWARFAPRDIKKTAGSGAAGAMAFGLAAFAGAKLARGTEFIMNALKWKDAARTADVIVTGEGRLDKTSFQGKVIGEIVRHRGRSRVWAVCGSSTINAVHAKRQGLDRVLTLKEFL